MGIFSWIKKRFKSFKENDDFLEYLRHEYKNDTGYYHDRLILGRDSLRVRDYYNKGILLDD